MLPTPRTIPSISRVLLGAALLATAPALPGQLFYDFPASPCWSPPGSGYEGRLIHSNYSYHAHAFETHTSIWRLASIDTWGPFSPQYGGVGAIWKRSRGPTTDNRLPWASYHLLTATDYQFYYNYWVGQGYFPSRICASGSELGPNRFACIFVKDGVHAYGFHNQLRSQFLEEILRARRNDYVLESISVHGEQPRRYHSVWRKNVNNVEWQLILDEDSGSYQTAFNSVTSGGFRPTYVTVSKNGPDRYTAIFLKPFPRAWVAYHDVPLTQHDEKARSLIERCYRPLHVARGNYNYAGVWTRP